MNVLFKSSSLSKCQCRFINSASRVFVITVKGTMIQMRDEGFCRFITSSSDWFILRFPSSCSREEHLQTPEVTCSWPQVAAPRSLRQTSCLEASPAAGLPVRLSVQQQQAVSDGGPDPDGIFSREPRRCWITQRGRRPPSPMADCHLISAPRSTTERE